MIRIGINGFGRIGRQVLKAILERHPKKLEVAAINDLFDVETNARLFKYDTNYGRFPGEVGVKKDAIVVNGKTIKSFAMRDMAELPWDEEGIDIVVESTGLFRTGPKAAAHLEAGAKKVIIFLPEIIEQRFRQVLSLSRRLWCTNGKSILVRSLVGLMEWKRRERNG